MATTFQDQRALITGGTKGIGKAAALRLARGGAHLILTYAGDERAALETQREVTEEGGGKADIVRADMLDADHIGELLDAVHAGGPLDMLVLNAAYQEKHTFAETDRALLARTLDMNVLGNFQLAHAVSQKMITAGVKGRIVVSGSPHAHLPFEDAFAYDISKAALHHMVRCMALPLIRHGIRVNGVEIGWTVTPGERRFTSVEEQQALSAKAIPIGRSAEPDEIAAVITFLCGPESSYMAGSIVPVEGGFMLQPCPDA